MKFETISFLKVVDILGMINASFMIHDGDSFGYLLLLLFAMAFYCFDLGDRYRASETKEKKK